MTWNRIALHTIGIGISISRAGASLQSSNPSHTTIQFSAVRTRRLVQPNSIRKNRSRPNLPSRRKKYHSEPTDDRDYCNSNRAHNLTARLNLTYRILQLQLQHRYSTGQVQDKYSRLHRSAFCILHAAATTVLSKLHLHLQLQLQTAPPSAIGSLQEG
ncbi:hypothetical protein F5884DRAFT_751611 [Xylogone sp. PMI_703]|nr:hypothetical protein F5884DRAFT_751611 [Xylogone sp. PMI_703]